MSLAIWISFTSTVMVIAILILSRVNQKWAYLHGYYDGRHDEAEAMLVSESAEDWLFNTRAQIADRLGEKEALRFIDGVQIHEKRPEE